MEDTTRRLREQIQQHKSERSQRPEYSPAIRQEIIAFAKEQRARGLGVHRIARELGFNTNTLYGWLRDYSLPAEFRPVEVSPNPRRTATNRGLAVVTARGLRVEGLDLQAVITLLRALA